MTSRQASFNVADVEHELQWRRCQSDPVFFMETFYQIPVVGQGPQPFRLRDYQKGILTDLLSADHVVSLKARQIGMTTVTVAYAVWHALFHPDSPWLFVSRNENAAKKMLQRAKYALLRLPKWFKVRLGEAVSETQTYLEFANGSYIESVPATGGTGRGDSVYGALLDEVAFMDYAEDIWAAVEPLVYGKAILISTANGMGNFFHDIWLDSERSDSIWSSTFLPWSVVPSRDAGWYRTRQLAHRGREWFFFQEYPSSPSEAFAKSGRVAFPLELLKNHDWGCEVERFWWTGEGLAVMDDGQDEDLVFNVFEPPVLDCNDDNIVLRQPSYVVSCDVAEGLEHGDFTVIKVFDANTGIEVLSHRSHLPVEDLGEVLEWVGYWYFTALIIVERNNHGMVPLTYLYKAGYPRLYRHREAAKRDTERRKEYGWSTTRKSKPKMVKDFLQALRQDQVLLRDREFMLEAQVFVADGRGSYAATAGKHDDDVMATIIGWQGVLDVDRFPLVWVDTTKHPTTFDEFFSAGDRSLRGAVGLDVPIGQATPKARVVSSIVVSSQTKR